MYSPKRRFRLFRMGPADAIAASLTTSLSAYTSAADGTWVSITSTEYSALQTNVASTSIGMTTASQLTLSSNANFSSLAFMGTNQPDSYCPAIPANSYLYAAVYRYGLAGQTGLQLYRNTASNVYSNFTKVGGDLPTTVNGYNYVVLKDTTSSPLVGASLAAIFTNTASASNMFYKHPATAPATVNARYAITSGPITTSTNLTSTSAGLNFAIQTLSTTSKQW